MSKSASIGASLDLDGKVHFHRPGLLAPTDRIAIPGFINAHSHAFQRALRGRVERRAPTGTDSFWSWRETMYAIVERLGPDDIEAISAWCFRDLLRAGYTAVGEFHYLHHDIGGAPYQDPLALSAAVVRAAKRVGIRLVLLETAYGRAGVGREVSPAQKRFIFENVESYLTHVDASRLAFTTTDADAATAAWPRVSVGLAIHSVRAVPASWLAPIAHYAAQHDLPLHVHASEQRRELVECQAEHGCSPIALLARHGVLGPRTVIVHGTHVDADDIALLAAHQAMVCLTPSTERNLGDGLCPIKDLQAAGVELAIGTDSHARIHAASELCAVEEQERLRLEQRCVLVPPGGHLADGLLPLVHRQGARALSLRNDETLASIAIPVGLEGASAPTPEQQVAIAVDAWLTGGGDPLPLPGETSTRLLDDEIDDAASASLRRLLGTHDAD